MTTYIANLLKVDDNTRAGTLAIPVWGQFHVEMELINEDDARLTVTQGEYTWRGWLAFCREDPDDFGLGDWKWSCEMSVGRCGGWTYRITGEKRGDVLFLEFDDLAKPSGVTAFLAANSESN